MQLKSEQQKVDISQSSFVRQKPKYVPISPVSPGVTTIVVSVVLSSLSASLSLSLIGLVLSVTSKKSTVPEVPDGLESSVSRSSVSPSSTVGSSMLGWLSSIVSCSSAGSTV